MMAARNFRSHKANRPHWHSGHPPVRWQTTCKAKVNQLYIFREVADKHHILRLDVEMDDARAMDEGHGFQKA